MSTTVPAVRVSIVSGVAVRRHILDVEAARLGGIAQRLGKRLQYILRNSPVHTLPDEEWRETFALYGKTVMQMLVEQRERAKLSTATGAVGLTDEDYQHELKLLGREAVTTMPDAEILAEAQRRGLLPGGR